jgi:hypothetical protein
MEELRDKVAVMAGELAELNGRGERFVGRECQCGLSPLANASWARGLLHPLKRPVALF